MNLSLNLRRGAIAAAIIIAALVVFFAPAPVGETVFGCIVITGIAVFTIRDQQRRTAETEAIIAQARAVNDRAQVLLGKKRRKIIV